MCGVVARKHGYRKELIKNKCLIITAVNLICWHNSSDRLSIDFAVSSSSLMETNFNNSSFNIPNHKPACPLHGLVSLVKLGQQN